MPEVDVGRPAGAVEVVELRPDGDEEYEEFVRAHPQALLYHSARFRDFLVDLLGCEPCYGVARAQGRIRGVLPLMAAAGPRGRVLNSLPFYGSNGGILAADAEAGAALAAWYRDCVASEGVAAATMIDNPLDPADPAPAHDVSDVRVGCMTPLAGAGDPDERLLALIDGSARRNVAKAVRSGVAVDVDNDAFDTLEDLHRAGMESIGGRPKSPAFFRAVPRCFRAGEDYDLYVARIGGEIVAALLVFFYGSVAEYYVPATRAESRSEQPMAAILRRAMVDAMGRGLTQWNWGGSWVSQENLIRFKTKWGGRACEYRYWTSITDPELLTAGPDELLAAYPDFFVVPFASLRPGPEVTG